MREGRQLQSFKKYDKDIKFTRWMWHHSVTDADYTSWAWGQPDDMVELHSVNLIFH